MNSPKLKSLSYVAVPLILISALIWVIFFRLPYAYSAAPIAGRVVDAQSGRAIPGAVVMAIWELRKGFGMETSITAGSLKVMEVLTDGEGRYKLPAWGPLRRPMGTYLGPDAPRLIVFKEDYVSFSRANDYDGTGDDRRRNEIQNSSWDGETIRLTAFNGSLEQYYGILLKVYLDLSAVFDPTFGAGPCDWTNIPEMVKRFDQYYIQLTAQDGGNRVYHIPDMNYLLEGGDCTPDE
jgi:hypothetical protein